MLKRILGWFSRRQKPDAEPWIDRRGLNEDWQVGDLAACEPQGSGTFEADDTGFRPKAGATYRVSAIIMNGVYRDRQVRATALVFENSTDQAGGWECCHFRKIRPQLEPADLEECEELRDFLKQPAEVD